MAKTYYAEGRQIAYALRALFVIFTLSFYLLFPKLHWGIFVAVFFIGIIAAEWIGASWTRKRRVAKKTSTSKTTSVTSTRKNVTTKESKARASMKLTDPQLITADIHALSGTDFERLMEMYYKDQGYSVERIGGSGDHEVDLILRGKEGYKIAVQCKRWKQNVGNDIVLRLKAGKQVHGCYDAWVVTTSNFTVKAREAAESLNIKLINGIALENKLNTWKKKKRS
ncbi:restriction endonuclease [Paenibacillus antarcticus]|uniref:Restriction endonuclease n=1 Tax=Paenibacillus antarcticus TaxID=253703 RepID=A0A168QP30_9BACL|nr:restriction endonuclease [Paenibacillus antarcticus]OAB48016.1 restriction endonuclease [Paenibacillus antarcticus]